MASAAAPKCSVLRQRIAAPPCDQPEGGDAGEEGDAGNVIAPCLERLMAGIELVPDEVQDAGRDGCQAKDIHADSHGAIHLQFARPC